MDALIHALAGIESLAGEKITATCTCIPSESLTEISACGRYFYSSFHSLLLFCHLLTATFNSSERDREHDEWIYAADIHENLTKIYPSQLDSDYSNSTECLYCSATSTRSGWLANFLLLSFLVSVLCAQNSQNNSLCNGLTTCELTAEKGLFRCSLSLPLLTPSSLLFKLPSSN